MFDKTAFAERLDAQIALTEAKIIGYEDMAAPVSPDDAIGRVSRMDAINNKAVQEAALAKAREKLTKLRLLRNNLDDPALGRCRRCKRPIPPGRLIAMPESTTCVRCSG